MGTTKASLSLIFSLPNALSHQQSSESEIVPLENAATVAFFVFTFCSGVSLPSIIFQWSVKATTTINHRL